MAAPLTADASGMGDRANILLVDDQPAKLLSYEAMLGDLGENLVHASSAREALEFLLGNDVAVMLIDVVMPELDGFELAAMIREHPRFQRTAIIMVSAVMMTDVDRLRGYHSGAMDYVPVPVVPEILRAKVSVFLDLYRKTRRLERLNEELERRVAERTADLQESERQYRLLADTGPHLTWTMRPAHDLIEFTSRRFEEFTGVKAGELEAADWTKVVHPDDLPSVLAAIAEPVRRGEPYEVELRVRRQDGEYRRMVARAIPVRDDKGTLTKWVGTTTDIHDRWLATEALQEADRRKNEFLALLAHELRNPLAPLRNGLQLLTMSEDPAIRDKALTVMDRQLRHMVRLVDDLLDVSRITRGKLELRRERVLVDAVLRDAVEAVQPLMEASHHALEVSMPNEPLPLLADATRLAQVFGNLLNNACKYTPAGGHIHLIVERKTRDLVVRVRDNGIGIPAEMLDSIFDVFTQVDRSLERTSGGLGIGLSMARRLAEMHGGQLTAHSSGPGQGSEFVVTLPLAGAPVQTLTPAVSHPGLDTGQDERRAAAPAAPSRLTTPA
jgi:PAS domain S-box-containing protein